MQLELTATTLVGELGPKFRSRYFSDL